MIFDGVNTPQDLMAFMDQNIQYGVVKNDGTVLHNNNAEFEKACQNDWRMRSCEDIVQSGVGMCYDQVEVERQWFADNNYEFRTYWSSAYQPNVEYSGCSHTYLVYKDNDTNKYNIFEHADVSGKGIISFNSPQEAVKYYENRLIGCATQQAKPQDQYSVCTTEYSKPEIGLTFKEYLDFVITNSNKKKQAELDEKLM